MAEEEYDLDLESDVEKRIKDLSRKVKLTSEERDEKDRLLNERDEQLGTVSKERDFYASFSDSISKYPSATEYKEAIKEKVMSGYTVEDATVAVLAKEGKLTTPPPPETPKENPAGGSAPTNIGKEPKEFDQMSKDDQRSTLAEMLGESLGS